MSLLRLEISKLAEEQLHLAQVRLASKHSGHRAVDLDVESNVPVSRSLARVVFDAHPAFDSLHFDVKLGHDLSQAHGKVCEGLKEDCVSRYVYQARNVVVVDAR
jgi:hypothetical protein